MVPDYGCFALVGDADCFDGFGGVALLFEGCYGAFDTCLDGADEFQRVVFVPSVVD